MPQQARLLRGSLFAALASIAIASSATAQPGPGGPGWGPGMMMGPGMMGGQGFGFLCNPRMAGFAEWRLAQIEVAVKPNDAQKAALEALKAASAKAAEFISADCLATPPANPSERLAYAEKRLEVMQQAIKMVRPAFDGFYAMLDDKQKTSFNAAGPRSWGWRSWRWRWSNE